MAIRLLFVAVILKEVVFRKLQDDCKQGEQLMDHIAINGLREELNLTPMLLYDLWLWSGILWN